MTDEPTPDTAADPVDPVDPVDPADPVAGGAAVGRAAAPATQPVAERAAIVVMPETAATASRERSRVVGEVMRLTVPGRAASRSHRCVKVRSSGSLTRP